MTNAPNIPSSKLRQVFRLLPVVVLASWVLVNLAKLGQWDTFALEIGKLVVLFSGLLFLAKALRRLLPDASPEASGRVLQLAFVLLISLTLLGDAQVLAASLRLLRPTHRVTDVGFRQNNTRPVGVRTTSTAARR